MKTEEEIRGEIRRTETKKEKLENSIEDIDDEWAVLIQKQSLITTERKLYWLNWVLEEDSDGC